MDIKYLPKIYAVNSNDSYKKLILNNFEMKKIINLEALRYYELYKKINKNISNKNIKTILIVSDVHNDGNKNLEKLLQNIIPSNFLNNIFLLKEHLLKKTNFSLGFKFNITKKKLFELQSCSRIAVVSSTTSAIIDLLIMGYEIIVPLNSDTLNFSPLKDCEQVTFISEYKNINEILKQKLNKIKNNNIYLENNFFNYNVNLSNWRKILNDY